MSLPPFPGQLREGSQSELREFLEKKNPLVPEETFTVELHRGPKQKLGLAVVGGIDNPNLRDIHVSWRARPFPILAPRLPSFSLEKVRMRLAFLPHFILIFAALIQNIEH